MLTNDHLNDIDRAAYILAPLLPPAQVAPEPGIMVYIAGPLTHGDQQANARAAHYGAGLLMQAGDALGQRIATFIPHAYLQCEGYFPRPYEKWMESCFIALRACDALVRLPGYSPGADREVAEARRLGIPVYIVEDLADELATAVRNLLTGGK